MATIAINLPLATLGVPYDNAISLTGEGPFKLGLYDVPPGFTVRIIGNQLIVRGTATEAYAAYEAVFEIKTGCDSCEPTIIVAAFSTTAGLTSCGECVPVTIPSVILPTAVYGEEYYALIPLSGSGPFTLCGGAVPYCLKAEIVGRVIKITGQVKLIKTPLDINLSVRNDCSCGCVDFTALLNVVGQPTCEYCWSMSPTIAFPGIPITTTVELPEGCSSTATLKLNVYKADGFTRETFQGIPLNLYLERGVSQYVVQNTDSGSHLVFKPDPVQHSCLAGCAPCVPFTERIVPTAIPCAITASITNQTITTAGVLRSYAIVGTPGCQIKQTIDGAINGVEIHNQQVLTIPPSGTFAFTDASGSLAGDSGDVTIAYAPLGACSASVLCGGPFRLISAVPASATPPTGACIVPISPITPTPSGFGCGNAVTRTFPVGQAFSLTQNMSGATSVVVSVSPTNPAISVTNGSSAGVVFAPNPPTGVFTLTFTGSKTDCPDCVVTYIYNFTSNTTVGCPAPVSPFSPVPTGYGCGNTVPRSAPTTSPFSLTQSFTGADSVVASVSPVNASLTTSNGTNSASVTGATPTTGSYTLTFTATRSGCPPCVVSYLYTFSAVVAPPQNCTAQAVIDGTNVFQRVWSNQSNANPLWPVGVPFVIRLDIEPGDTTTARFLATITFSDAGPARADRRVSVSRVCGDFSGSSQLLLSGVPSNSGSGSVSIIDPRAADVLLAAGGTWYINIENISNAGDFLVDWAN